MYKKCTNSSCRKTFSTLYFDGNCPFCGKKYPQLVSRGKHGKCWAVRILDHNGQKVKAIKVTRVFFNMGLKEAKAVVDRIPDPVFILEAGEAKQFMEQLSAFGSTCVSHTHGSRMNAKTILMPSGKNACP